MVTYKVTSMRSNKMSVLILSKWFIIVLGLAFIFGALLDLRALTKYVIFASRRSTLDSTHPSMEAGKKTKSFQSCFSGNCHDSNASKKSTSVQFCVGEKCSDAEAFQTTYNKSVDPCQGDDCLGANSETKLSLGSCIGSNCHDTEASARMANHSVKSCLGNDCHETNVSRDSSKYDTLGKFCAGDNCRGDLSLSGSQNNDSLKNSKTFPYITSHNDDNKDSAPFIAPNISLEDAYFQRMRSVKASDLDEKLTVEEAGSFVTRFRQNQNYMNFPVLVLENVCMKSDGQLLLIGLTPEELEANIGGPTAIAELWSVWHDNYACNGHVGSDNCAGYNFSSRVPDNHAYVKGTTAHMMPYIGNSMHNFAERIWMYIAAVSEPVSSTLPLPISNYVIHGFEKWLKESKSNTIPEQFLWQFRWVMELEKNESFSPQHILLDNIKGGCVVCCERLLLQQNNKDRMDETRLPLNISGPGLKGYRDAAFSYLGLQVPQVHQPPEKLRVLFYGRSDSSRREIVNQIEVLNMLRNFSKPPLEVMHLDEMLSTRETNYSVSEVIRVYTQTDILITVHGSNTWATILLPEQAGVIEIFGPCNWASYDWKNLLNLRTWIIPMAAAAQIKHDISNPYKDAVANPKRGNTTSCIDPISGVPDFTIDISKLQAVINSFGKPSITRNNLYKHWHYDWVSPLPTS